MLLSFRSNTKPTILCVDDERSALEVRRMMLESAGFQVCTAATAGEAIQVVKRQSVDLVLTDYYLDGSTGGQLAHAIKEARPKLPVAIYSGAVELPEDAEYADTVIAKIDGTAALIDSILSLLKQERKAA